MKKIKKLPIGIQSFERMITKNFIYIDKTKYIYELVMTGECYFLSRPRRFGKSLLISTLEQLFLGNKKLFDNLYITHTDYDWPQHPVVHLSFSGMNSKTAEHLEKDLDWTLNNIAKRYELNVNDAPSIETKLRSLVEQLSSKNNVVILIDEYDYPLLNNIHNQKIADDCRKLLHNFFAVLKDLAPFLHFIFITGITKFSKTSIFSGLNNLNDLTLSTKAAQLLGYTHEEIITQFEQYFTPISNNTGNSTENILESMRSWYNGYQFTEEKFFDKSKSLKVYNPFSVINYLNEGRMLNYWFETGTPSFLMHLIKTQNYPIDNIEGSEVNLEETRSYEINKIKLIPLLWQTGYLTIDSYNPATKNYKLRYPNEEVVVSFLHYILEFLTEKEVSFWANATEALSQSLKNNDLNRFFQTMQIFFADIPYTMQLPLEKYYQSIFYVILKLIGVKIHGEVVTNEGRIDAVIETVLTVFIFEFKLKDTAENALRQIEEKKYYQKYLGGSKKIILIGVQFDMEKRNIHHWMVKEYTK